MGKNMKLHPALNMAEIGEMYYKKLGKFKSREQARKNFRSLVHPDPEILAEIEKEIKESELFRK